MQTLNELNSGQLKNSTHLKISENLTQFPQKIFELSDTLEILDLSNNQLTELPDLSQFKKLKIAFFSNNSFTHLPHAFKNCQNLYMLGLKANKIKCFDEDILPLTISWLILTDNKIEKLPNSMGNLLKLQKCALAGNLLTTLPSSMENCRNIELIRLSANRLRSLPSWLLSLPKLSWLAFSGNSFNKKPTVVLESMKYSEFSVEELLGEGASGEIYRAHHTQQNRDVALKIFKGAVTSDGYAEDEMDAYSSIGKHPNLIEVLAKIDSTESLGLVLKLISPNYTNLGYPPNFETCTRDTFKDSQTFTSKDIYTIIKAILSAATHLHSRGLMHGDLYAHNILINDDLHTFLGDFGAASFYDKSNENYEKIEVRAFGCLIDDLLTTVCDRSNETYLHLRSLAKECMQEDISKRALFSEIEL